jgi:hypothetical protein
LQYGNEAKPGDQEGNRDQTTRRASGAHNIRGGRRRADAYWRSRFAGWLATNMNTAALLVGSAWIGNDITNKPERQAGMLSATLGQRRCDWRTGARCPFAG